MAGFNPARSGWFCPTHDNKDSGLFHLKIWFNTQLAFMEGMKVVRRKQTETNLREGNGKATVQDG